MQGVVDRVNDALFLWDKGRKESAFLLALVGVAAVSKLRYPKERDGVAFQNYLKDCHTVKISVEYKGECVSIEKILYKWMRCELIHEGALPPDIQFVEESQNGMMTVRAGGQPDYILKIGNGWFYHMIDSVMKSNEIINNIKA